MKRYEGFLRPMAKPAPWPSRWVVVETVGRPLPVTARERLRRTGLDEWHAVILSMRGAECICGEEASGNLASGLWALLVVASNRPGTTWVISPRALYSWTLLGLFERLLLGTINVHNKNPRIKRPLPDRGITREPGLLLTNDPPSAALFTLAEGGKPITWVCASNYGWGGMFSTEEGLNACRQLGCAVTESSAALLRHSLGGWCTTVGAMAMRSWRSQFLKESIYVSEREEYKRLCTAAAFGGRLLCRPTHGKPVMGYRVDARGLYCALAISSSLPCGCGHYRRGGDSAALRDGASAAETIAAVQLRRAGGRFPSRVGEQVAYPLGNCETVLAGPELAEAIRGGYVSQIGESYEFKQGNPIREFEEATKSMRGSAQQSSSGYAAALAKGLAVALVGKLAAREETWEEIEADYNDPIYGQWPGPDGRGGTTIWRSIAGQVSRLRRTELAWYAVPEIPIWLWSLGRVWLWERMQAAGMEDVLYCDTDGLIVTERGYERLQQRNYIRDNEWGELRYIGGPDECEVMGPKMVRFGAEIVAAGQPRSQRNGKFVQEGFWFRSSLDGSGAGFATGIWEEEYRARKRGAS